MPGTISKVLNESGPDLRRRLIAIYAVLIVSGPYVPRRYGVDERVRGAERQAASRSGALALVHAHGISSSRRAAGQRLTSRVRTSAI